MNKIKKQNSPVWYHWISAPTRAAAQKRQMLGFSSHCCHSIINNCCNNINLWFPWTLYVKFCKTVRKSQIKKCMQLQQQLQQLQQHLQQHLPHLLQLLQQLCIFNITQTFYFKFCKMVKKNHIRKCIQLLQQLLLQPWLHQQLQQQLQQWFCISAAATLALHLQYQPIMPFVFFRREGHGESSKINENHKFYLD